MLFNGHMHGPVFVAAGTLGFNGEGYPHHETFPWSLADWSGAELVTKTVTLERNEGNMSLHADGMTPMEFKPGSIWVNPVTGDTLNAVRISNLGIRFYLPAWEQRQGSFGISVISIKETASERRAELGEIANILRAHLPLFKGHPFLEINFSCPNVGLQTSALVHEVTTCLEIAASLGIPLVPNFSVELSIADAHEISRHPKCAALSIANTVHAGNLRDRIPWKKIYRGAQSPLQQYGGGGLSGPRFFPVLLDWLRMACMTDYRFAPLIVGGGIFSVDDVEQVARVGWPLVRGIKLATVGLHRPWRVKKMIQHGNEKFRDMWRGEQHAQIRDTYKDA